METQKKKLTAIADAIREREGSEEPIVASEFPERIRTLSGGGMTQEEADGRYLGNTGAQILKDGCLSFIDDTGSSILEIMSSRGVNGEQNDYYIAFTPEHINFGKWSSPDESGIDQNYDIGIMPGNIKNEAYDSGMVRCLEIQDWYWGEPGVILRGILAPMDPNDAANKEYVDRENADKLSLSGGSLSNKESPGYRVNIFSPEDEFAGPLEVWLDGPGTVKNGTLIMDGFVYFVHVDTKGEQTGEIIEGNDGKIVVYKIDKNGNDSPLILTGIAAPQNDFDTANKKYVDDAVKAAVGDIAAALDAINGEVI